jgi:hypothetical protein
MTQCGVHACNSSYLRGRDREDRGLRSVRKRVSETSISTNKPTVVAQACDASFMGGVDRRTEAEGQSGKKCKTLAEK